jgi:signal transduction histidine kinase
MTGSLRRRPCLVILASLSAAGAVAGAAAWTLFGVQAGATALATAAALIALLRASTPWLLRQAMAPLQASLAHARNQRRRLAADAAHALRTPVAHARAQVDDLSGLRLPQGTRRRVQSLRFDIDRISRCVETVLDAAQAEPLAGTPVGNGAPYV